MPLASRQGRFHHFVADDARIPPRNDQLNDLDVSIFLFKSQGMNRDLIAYLALFWFNLYARILLVGGLRHSVSSIITLFNRKIIKMFMPCTVRAVPTVQLFSTA